MSASLYSVIQIVPDPIRDERVNVGVLVVDEAAQRVAVQIKPRLREIRALAPALDTRFLIDLQERLLATLTPAAEAGAGLLRERLALDRLVVESANIVQFTPPGVSSRPLNELIPHLLHRFVERQAAPRHPRAFRDKGMLKRRITRQFSMLGLSGQLDKNIEISSDRVRCVFDYGLRLGGPEFSRVMQALSLEARERDAVDQARRELHAFWFDAGQVAGRLPVTLVAYLRGDNHELESEAHAVVDDLQIELVPAEDVARWASTITTAGH